MPENENEQDDELDSEHSNLTPAEQAAYRQKREAEKKAEVAEAALATTQRELAIERAGIPDSPAKALFLKAYDGPPDSELIRAEADKYGLLQAPGAGGVTAAEIEAQRQVLQAATGQPAPGDIDAAVAMRNAKSQAEVMEIIRAVAGQGGFKSADGLVGVLPQI